MARNRNSNRRRRQFLPGEDAMLERGVEKLSVQDSIESNPKSETGKECAAAPIAADDVLRALSKFIDGEFVSSLSKSAESELDNARVGGAADGEWTNSGSLETRRIFFSYKRKNAELAARLDKEIFEVLGTVKWFDVAKGYGFIAPDDDAPDVLLNMVCLRSDGFLTAHPGARIRCQVLRKSKGLQAFRVLWMESGVPNGASPATAAAQLCDQWRPALVKWFNRVRGFGFLSLGAGKPDVRVEMATLRSAGLDDLRFGQLVSVQTVQDGRGLKAARIRVPGAPRN